MKWSKRRIVSYLIFPPKEGLPKAAKTMKRALGIAQAVGKGAEIWRDVKRYRGQGFSLSTEKTWVLK